MGAIASGGVRVLNHDVIRQLGIDRVTAQELRDRATRAPLSRGQAGAANEPAHSSPG